MGIDKQKLEFSTYRFAFFGLEVLSVSWKIYAAVYYKRLYLVSQVWHHGKSPILKRTYHQWRRRIPRRKEHSLWVILSGSALPQRNSEDPELVYLMSTLFWQASIIFQPLLQCNRVIVNYGRFGVSVRKRGKNSWRNLFAIRPGPESSYVEIWLGITHAYTCVAARIMDCDAELFWTVSNYLKYIASLGSLLLCKLPSNHICYLKQK